MVRILKNHSNRSHTKAQALMEAALIFPILLLLIIGAVDFGRMYYTKMAITNAAREGASYYTTNAVCKTTCTFSACSTALKAVVVESGASSGVVVVNSEISLPTTCGNEGATSSVTVTKNVSLMFGGFLSAVGIVSNPLTLTSTATMVVQ